MRTVIHPYLFEGPKYEMSISWEMDFHWSRSAYDRMSKTWINDWYMSYISDYV